MIISQPQMRQRDSLYVFPNNLIQVFLLLYDFVQNIYFKKVRSMLKFTTYKKALLRQV